MDRSRMLTTDVPVTSRLDAKARTVVPKAVRDALGIEPGQQIGYAIHDGCVVLTAVGKPLSQDAPFACFDEWASQTDTEGYASL
jgi:antitoxin PrlF